MPVILQTLYILNLLCGNVPQFSAFLKTETYYSMLLTLPLLSAVISVDTPAISRYAIFFHSFFCCKLRKTSWILMKLWYKLKVKHSIFDRGESSYYSPFNSLLLCLLLCSSDSGFPAISYILDQLISQSLCSCSLSWTPLPR